MFHVYGELFTNSIKGSDFKKFTIARFARVYPLHFITLMYTIILFFVSAKVGVPKNLIGEVENKGWELSAKWTDKKGDLSYSIGGMLLHCRLFGNYVLFNPNG